MTPLALCAAWLVGSAGGLAAGPDAVLESLVAAERAFAGAALARGVRGGFLEYLAEEAIVFRPRPVAARAWYEASPEGREILTWEPVLAEASASGDLGYTSGPWELKSQPSDADPKARGHYLSIWARRPDGSWRVLLDAGVSHGRPEPHAGPVATRRSTQPRGERSLDESKLSDERSTLLRREAALSSAAVKGASVKKLIAALSDDVRVYREGSLPIVGKSSARAALGAEPGTTTWRTEGAVVSRAGDLGYTYGVAASGAGGTGGPAGESSYLRIWRKSGGAWEVVLDLAVPIPA